MKVIKRDCTVVDFDKTKIYTAIMKAMKNGSGLIKEDIAKQIAREIENDCSKLPEEIDISAIEAMVFKKLVEKGQELTAKAYEGYRSVREFQRENYDSIDSEVLGLIEDANEEIKDENANKNSVLNPTKRDYIAGIVSEDATERYLLPPEIVQAHKEGIIHFHDRSNFLSTHTYKWC